MTSPPGELTLDIHFRLGDIDEFWNDLADKIQKFCDQLGEYRKYVYAAASAIAISNPLMAPQMVFCCGLYESIVHSAVPMVIRIYNDVNQWIFAGFNFSDLADGLNKADAHATLCKQSLVRTAMPADSGWMGPSVDAYYGHIEKHHAAAQDVEEALISVRRGIQDFGTQATVATLAAIAALIQAVVEAIVGVVALIPPATPIGAGLITVAVTLFGATVAALIVFAQKAAESINELKTAADQKLRSDNFPGGAWPRPSSLEVRTQIQDVEGWDWE